MLNPPALPAWTSIDPWIEPLAWRRTAVEESARYRTVLSQLSRTAGHADGAGCRKVLAANWRSLSPTALQVPAAFPGAPTPLSRE